jgi:hypothetical protein
VATENRSLVDRLNMEFPNLIEVLISLTSGATAGVISRSVTAPFDRLKTIMQMVRNDRRQMDYPIFLLYFAELNLLFIAYLFIR